MKLSVVHQKDEWDNFVIKNDTNSFLHSWEWGEFNTSLGNSCWRYGTYDKDELVSVALVVKVRARRGTFLFIPHGPIFSTLLTQKKIHMCLTLLTHHLACRNEGGIAHFIRMSPTLERTKKNEDLFSSLGFRFAPIHVHSEMSWVLSLNMDEQTLLKNMRKTTRSLIRKYAYTKETYSTLTLPTDSLDDFLHIYGETVKRTGFAGYSNSYMSEEFAVFARSERVKLYQIHYNNTVKSCAFVITYGSSGFYHHGASLIDTTGFPYQHLLQWYIIQDLKKRGFSLYNFWGVSPQDKPNHPWYGLTLFKKGFGGEARQYLQTQDLPLQWRYWINYVIETIRKKRRRY